MRKTKLAIAISEILAHPPEPLPEPMTLAQQLGATWAAIDYAHGPDKQVWFWRRSWGEPPGGYDIVYLEDIEPLEVYTPYALPWVVQEIYPVDELAFRGMALSKVWVD